MYLRKKVALTQAALLGGALAALLGVSWTATSKVVQGQGDALQRERLKGVLSRLAAEHAALQRSGLAEVDEFVHNAQQALLAELAKDAGEPGGARLFVVDREGAVLLMPGEAAGARPFAGTPVSADARGEGGTAELELEDDPTWATWAGFAPWSWTVGFAVPQDDRTADARRLLATLALVSAVAFAVIQGITAWAAVLVGRVVRGVVRAAEQVREAVRSGRLAVRADAAAVEAEFRPIVEVVNETMDAFARPISVTADYVARISRGDIPPPIDERYEGDFNRIREALNACVETLRRLVEDTARMTEAQRSGDLDAFIDDARFEGAYRAMAAGVNDNTRMHVANTLEALAVLGKYGEGDFAPVLRELPGKQAILNRTFEAIRSNLQAVAAEVGEVTRAAAEGKLSRRADASRFHGDWRRLVQGFNEALDAIVQPLEQAAASLERISRGDVPERITEGYAGDFAHLKESLNRSIDAIRLLISDVDGLAGAAVAGRLETRADATRHSGDFRRIVEGVNRTLDAVLAPIAEAAAVLERLSERDLCARVDGEYQGDHARLAGSLNATAQALHDALRQVAAAVDQVSSAASQIASSSQAVASGASQQAASLAETTSSVQAVSGVTRQSAAKAQEASGLAAAARAAAAEGSASLDAMHAAMGRIRAAAEGTSQIIKDINDIAFQTNLLALNAAVEAARAGEAGRGFAVVAEEVRSLALRAKVAATKTEELIRQSVREAEGGEATARHVAGKLGEIVGGVGSVSAVVGEIAVATREQAAGVEQVTRAISEMDRVTQQNAASAEQSSSAASELSGQSEELAAMVGAFHLDLGASRAGHRGLPPAEPAGRRSGSSRASG